MLSISVTQNLAGACIQETGDKNNYLDKYLVDVVAVCVVCVGW
jgi:hypothetical protein